MAEHGKVNPITLNVSLLYLVARSSGGPTEGIRGSAERTGEEDSGGGETEAAGGGGEKEGCGFSGETSETVVAG